MDPQEVANNPEPSLAIAQELRVAQLGQPGAMQLLRRGNSIVHEIGYHEKLLAWSMAKTMYSEPGVGLAAPQVGVNVHLLVVDPTWTSDRTGPQNPIIMFNPSLDWASDEAEVAEESCLSVPDLIVPVKRALEIEVSYHDLDYEPRTVSCEGWEARVLLHELDHLEGKLLVDYLSPLKRDMYMRRITKRVRKALNVAKRTKSNADHLELSKRRMERSRCGNVPAEPSPSAEGSGAPSGGSGAGTPESGLEYNQPEGV